MINTTELMVVYVGVLKLDLLLKLQCKTKYSYLDFTRGYLVRNGALKIRTQAYDGLMQCRMEIHTQQVELHQ